MNRPGSKKWSGEGFGELLIFGIQQIPNKHTIDSAPSVLRNEAFRVLSMKTFSPLSRTRTGLLRNPAKVGFSENTWYILFSLIVCRQCLFSVGNSLALVWLGRVGLRLPTPTAPRSQDPKGYRSPAHPRADFQDLPICLWTPWHSSPQQRHYPPWEQCGHSAVFRAP